MDLVLPESNEVFQKKKGRKREREGIWGSNRVLGFRKKFLQRQQNLTIVNWYFIAFKIHKLMSGMGVKL